MFGGYKVSLMGFVDRRRFFGNGLGGGDFFPAPFGFEINVFLGDIESGGFEEPGDALRGFHGFAEAAGEEFDVFFIGIEGELAVGEEIGQTLIVMIDELEETGAETLAHFGIDDDAEGIAIHGDVGGGDDGGGFGGE